MNLQQVFKLCFSIELLTFFGNGHLIVHLDLGSSAIDKSVYQLSDVGQAIILWSYKIQVFHVMITEETELTNLMQKLECFT